MERCIYNGVTELYHELLSFMEDEEILDPLNEFDLAALHYMFLPLLNDKLDAWLQAWINTVYEQERGLLFVSGYLVRGTLLLMLIWDLSYMYTKCILNVVL